jgi:two-component system OmpR family response regulator
MLSLALKTAGFHVIAAGTQQQAQHRLAHIRPDALVLNLQRSKADGLDLLLSVRARPDLSSVPIVFLAGSDLDNFRWQVINAGADWFGLRPLRMRDLKKRLRLLIRMGRPAGKLVGARHSSLWSRRLKLTV